ncbi:MAG: 4-oxalocrotonate tautomerase [Lactobacillales bacterium]|nr:4-oxalocrotonate tautomerase [Lactobacillales bacterium]
MYFYKKEKVGRENAMPFVNIDLFEGRTLEQKQKLAKEVTEVVSKNIGVPKEMIYVFIHEMKEGDYYPHGEMHQRKK